MSLPNNQKERGNSYPKRGYTKIAIEFLIALIVLGLIGGLLSIEHSTLGITSFYEFISKLILLGLGVALMLALVRVPLKNQMEARSGKHFASMVTFFATIIVAIGAFIALLSILSISFTSLIVAVGGISIVIGFAISTITSNVISGAFMLTVYPIKVGQRIIITVNNQPGTITDVGALFLTVTTDAGAELIIPNSAIMQGYAYLLDVNKPRQTDGKSSTQLLAQKGDRVISTLYPYPATVIEATSVVTKILTDAGQILTIPNQSILNGSSGLVKIQNSVKGEITFPITVGDEVRLGGSNFVGHVTEIGPDYFTLSGNEEEVVLPTPSISTGGIVLFKKRKTASSSAIP